jgi:hypothetical protein
MIKQWCQCDVDSELASLARDWHDFYALVGTAAATLVGLMFVAASIGASTFNEKHLEPMRAFITPTVFHFAIALLICILATIPTQTWGHARAFGRSRWSRWFDLFGTHLGPDFQPVWVRDRSCR